MTKDETINNIYSTTITITMTAVNTVKTTQDLI